MDYEKVLGLLKKNKWRPEKHNFRKLVTHGYFEQNSLFNDDVLWYLAHVATISVGYSCPSITFDMDDKQIYFDCITVLSPRLLELILERSKELGFS